MSVTLGYEYDYFPPGEVAKNVDVYEFGWFSADIAHAGFEPHSYSPGEQSEARHRRFYDSLHFTSEKDTFLTIKFLPADKRTSNDADGRVKMNVDIADPFDDPMDDPAIRRVLPVLIDNNIPVYRYGQMMNDDEHLDDLDEIARGVYER